jgi:hypothetical protein
MMTILQLVAANFPERPDGEGNRPLFDFRHPRRTWRIILVALVFAVVGLLAGLIVSVVTNMPIIGWLGGVAGAGVGAWIEAKS